MPQTWSEENPFIALSAAQIAITTGKYLPGSGHVAVDYYHMDSPWLQNQAHKYRAVIERREKTTSVCYPYCCVILRTRFYSGLALSFEYPPLVRSTSSINRVRTADVTCKMLQVCTCDKFERSNPTAGGGCLLALGCRAISVLPEPLPDR